MYLTVQEEWCKGCELCAASCPRNLLVLAPHRNQLGYHPVFLQEPKQCNGCGLCALMCPDLAITITQEVR